MFCIRIADIPVRIDNRYSYVHRLCEDYEVNAVPAFTVRVSEEEILEEQKGDTHYSAGYCESLCIYRKICCKLAEYDAFLMHAAAVAVDGKAYIFTAPSGVGKTTHIRLWLEQFGRRAQVVNGDKPIFRYIEDVLYVCGTPWQGKEKWGLNIIRPVQAICFLEQSPTNKILLLDKAEIIRRIFSQLLIPREEKDFNYFWKLLERTLESTNFYLLKCNRELDAVQLAYSTMRRD